MMECFIVELWELVVYQLAKVGTIEIQQHCPFLRWCVATKGKAVDHLLQQLRALRVDRLVGL